MRVRCRTVAEAAGVAVTAMLAVYYRRSHSHFIANLDFHVPSGRRSVGSSGLAGMRMHPRALSQEELAAYGERGYIVVRGAVPAEAVSELADAVRESFHLRDSGVGHYQHGGFFAKAYNMWLSASGAFADFVLHRDMPLGGLAAQLLGAERVRSANQGLNGISDRIAGARWHIDISEHYYFNASGASARDVGAVRFWLPLWPDRIDAGADGGSLSLLPLNESNHYRDHFAGVHGDCFGFATGRGEQSLEQMSEHCQAEMGRRVVTPDMAAGDLVMYSPQVAHRSQLMVRGTRVALTGQLYDPSLMAAIAEAAGSEPRREAVDILGVKPWFCADLSRRAYQGALYHHQAGPAAADLASEPSACFPQVYPELLAEEVQAVKLGRVAPWRPLRFWLLQEFPCMHVLAWMLQSAWYSVASA
mmetsp:Transcript_27743/g.86323  ORF Transcript_27743/g.86323 Transcript_27743/m.86323 type:complete len:417 (-) Transcript_27743:135-1385(-)